MRRYVLFGAVFVVISLSLLLTYATKTEAVVSEQDKHFSLSRLTNHIVLGASDVLRTVSEKTFGIDLTVNEIKHRVNNPILDVVPAGVVSLPDDKSFVVVNRAGQAIFTAFFDGVPIAELVDLESDDPNNDGLFEVIVGVRAEGDDMGKVFLYREQDRSDQTLQRFVPEPEEITNWPLDVFRSYGSLGKRRESFDILWIGAADVDRDGSTMEIIVVAADPRWYATRILVLNSVGDIRGEYLHSGRLDNSINLFTTVDKLYLIVSGNNNDLSGVISGSATEILFFLSLDLQELVNRQSPPAFIQDEQCQFLLPRRYPTSSEPGPRDPPCDPVILDLDVEDSTLLGIGVTSTEIVPSPEVNWYYLVYPWKSSIPPDKSGLSSVFVEDVGKDGIDDRIEVSVCGWSFDFDIVDGPVRVGRESVQSCDPNQVGPIGFQEIIGPDVGSARYYRFGQLAGVIPEVQGQSGAAAVPGGLGTTDLLVTVTVCNNGDSSVDSLGHTLTIGERQLTVETITASGEPLKAGECIMSTSSVSEPSQFPAPPQTPAVSIEVEASKDLGESK